MPRLKANQLGVNWQHDGAWCPGCGLHRHVTGTHRADCTSTPPPCGHCRYYPAVHGEHRPDCPEERQP